MGNLRIAFSFVLIMLFSTLAACGGGSGMFNLSLNANPAATATEHRISFLPAPEGQGLKRDVKYAYNYSGFPSLDGLTAVPVAAATYGTRVLTVVAHP